MAKVKIHIDDPDPSPFIIKKYKNFNKVEGRMTRYYTLKGFLRALRRNKLLLTVLFVAWVLLLLWWLE